MTASRFTCLCAIFTAAVTLAPALPAVSPPPDGGYPNDNTAEGTDALFSITTGTDNTALGFTALHNVTTGNFNTATGSLALSSNFAGSGNTAAGYRALSANTTGEGNTALGKDALIANTSGSVNTATGDVALLSNTLGSANTATGVNALAFNTTAVDNTATGFASLMNNATGNYNTASGANALLNSTGNNNIALGYQAGLNLTSGDNNIFIGNPAAPNESNRIRIGTQGVQNSTYIAGIFGTTLARGLNVVVDNKGRLGTVTSSARFKDRIQPMGTASESILALEPVTFRDKESIDPKESAQFGLVAEQVAQVNPDLIVRDDGGHPYSVRYEAVNAMLLNEFLKEHRKVETLEAAVEELKATLRTQAEKMQAVEDEVRAAAGSRERTSRQ